MQRGRPRNTRPRTIGLRIRRMRKARGLSIAGLARTIGSNRSSVRYWEQCKEFPSLAVLYRLRAALGCEWAALLGE